MICTHSEIPELNSEGQSETGSESQLENWIPTLPANGRPAELSTNEKPAELPANEKAAEVVKEFSLHLQCFARLTRRRKVAVLLLKLKIVLTMVNRKPVTHWKRSD